MKWLTPVIFFCLTGPHALFGQQNILIDTATYNIENLVRDILIQSRCADISNIQFTGNAGQIGYFSSGEDAVQVERGILLSTGRVHDAIGPNERTGTSTDYFDGSHVGDEDLRRVANVSVNDLRDDAILEFDFIPLDDRLEFEFVFASEEYCDFAGPTSPYNDVFGFFLSGPDISGPYTNNAENIAVSPNGSDNITVLNINHNINYDYFIDNTPLNQPLALPEHYQNCRLDVPRDGITSLLERDGASIESLEYDGYTIILRAERDVTPLQQYHLKIGIADVVDGNWDSAVFLKAGSFQTGQPEAIIELPDTLDCAMNSIVIHAENSTRGKEFSYIWTTEDGNVVSGANGYNPTVDQPGTYQLVVNRTGTTCGDTASVTVVFKDDQPNIVGAFSDTITCKDPTSTIRISENNASQYTFQIGYPDGSFSNITGDTVFQTSQGGWHTLYSYSPTGCEDLDVHFVDVDTFSGSVQFDSYELTCRDSILWITPDFNSGSSSFSHAWSTLNGDVVSPTDSLNILVRSPGDYLLTSTANTSGCSSESSLTVSSDFTTSVISAGADDILRCDIEELSLSGTIENRSGLELINWLSIGGNPLKQGIDELHPIICAADSYILSVENDNGCLSRDTIVVLPPQDAPIIELIRVDTLSCDLTTGIIDIAVDGSFASIQWETDDGNIEIISALGLTIYITSVGRYHAEVVNEDGCMTDIYVDVVQRSLPIANAGEDKILDCEGQAVLQAEINVGTPQLSYLWRSLNNPNFSSTSTAVSIDEPGLYILEVFDQQSGCYAFDSVAIGSTVNEVDYYFEFTACQFDVGNFYIDPNQTVHVDSILVGTERFISDAVVQVEGLTQIEILLANGCHQPVDLEYLGYDSLKVTLLAPNEITAGIPFNLLASVNRPDDEIASITWVADPMLSCADCLQQSHNIERESTVEIHIEDIYGCSQSTSIHLDPIIPLHVFVPSAFSPNDDAINDHLEIFTNEFVSSIRSVVIFDRWGSQVFAQTNNADGTLSSELFYWDGTLSNGKSAPEGVYVMHVNLISNTGIPITYSGELVLLR